MGSPRQPVVYLASYCEAEQFSMNLAGKSLWNMRHGTLYDPRSGWNLCHRTLYDSQSLVKFSPRILTNWNIEGKQTCFNE